MFRFAIRDLLWLTVLAVVLVAWWRDHAALSNCLEILREHVQFLKPLDDQDYDRILTNGISRIRRLPPGCGH
jgi:hypothetical protein